MSTDSRDSRLEAVTGLFSAFDLDGNGTVGLQELLQVTQSSRRVADKKHMKRVRLLEAEVRQAVETNRKIGGGLSSVSLKSGGLVTFAVGEGEPSLDPTAFATFMLELTKDDSQEDFESFVALATQAVNDARERTQGSSFRRAVWSVFQLLDVNQDGFVDMKELEALLAVETKNDKKAIAKWRSVAAQKQRESLSLAPINDPTAATMAALASTSVSPEATAMSSAEHTVSSAPPPADGELRLVLSDFQSFIHEFVEGSEERIREVMHRVREAMQAEYDKYLNEHHVNDILDAILDDLIRERPTDVLSGISRSVERLKRSGTYSRSGLRRLKSIVRVPESLESVGSAAPTEPTSPVGGKSPLSARGGSSTTAPPAAE